MEGFKNYQKGWFSKQIKPDKPGVYTVLMVSNSGRNVRTDKARWDGKQFLSSRNFGLRDDQITDWKEIEKTMPKFKTADRCMFIYLVGKHKIESVLDDKMIIESEPEWDDEKLEWCYDIIGKANPTPESYLKIYKK